MAETMSLVMNTEQKHSILPVSSFFKRGKAKIPEYGCLFSCENGV